MGFEDRIKAMREGRKLAELDKRLAEAEPGRGGRGADVLLATRQRVLALDKNAAPFENLSANDMLSTHKDPDGFAQSRFSTGMFLRDLFIGAEVKRLQSVDLDGVATGGPPAPVGDYKIDCMKALDRSKLALSNARPSPRFRIYHREFSLFGLLEDLVYRDRWVLDGLRKSEREAVLERVHFALDVLALEWGYVTPEAFRGRWS